MATATRSHPTPRTYWLVALLLGAITAVEISVPYIDALDPVSAVLLIAFGVAKFLIVVGVFMHLRYDLAGYRALFFVGVIGALIVFAVVLAAFRAL